MQLINSTQTTHSMQPDLKKTHTQYSNSYVEITKVERGDNLGASLHNRVAIIINKQ